MSEIKDRFYEVMDKLSLTDYRVYTDVKGITKNIMTKLRNGETNKVSTDVISLFCSHYGVSADYILTGRNSSPVITDNRNSENDIKILDIRVCAGHGIGFDGDENKVVGYVNIPDFAGCYGITVYGDSMYDKYASGEVIFVRKITDIKNIDNGQPYVVITNEDRFLKMVYIEGDILKLVSYNISCNPDGRRKYPDITITGDNILYFYKVVGKLGRTQM